MPVEVDEAPRDDGLCKFFARAMSTACLACALLDHSAAVAASSHASARLPQNKQLVILEGSLAQSAACVVREMVRRNEARYVASC